MIIEAPTRTQSIRAAIVEDIPRMVEMGQRFLWTSHYNKFLSNNPDQMAKLCRYLLSADGGGILITELDHQIVGMLGYTIYPHPISGERTAGELFWWVEPEARGDGIRLLRTFECTAKAAGATSVQMIAPDTKIEALYMRLGYNKLETTYQRPL